jgi:hypothetical protein
MRIIKYVSGSLLLVASVAFAGCDLDLEDPNSPNESSVITDPAGLKQIAVGLQAEYSNELVDPVYISGLVSDEIGAIPQAFESYRLVDAGGPVPNDLGPSTETWTGQYDVVQVADVLLENVPLVPTLGPEMSSALIALAKTYKAMAFGNLLQVYERIPVEVGLDETNPAFATRAEGLTAVLELLQEARQQLPATPPAEFTNTILAPGFNLLNTIDAMIARYALVVGNLDEALNAAQRVNLNLLSEFRFAATDPNPLWNMFLNSGNAFRMLPEDRFRTGAEAGDARVAYWVQEAATGGSAAPLDAFNRYSTREESFPAFLPDEMRLIQAEVHARRNNTAQALILLNQVRTQCTSTVNEPRGCLTPLTAANVPSQQALLDAVLRAREYELYLQGVRWADLRRFGKTVKYPFMSVPSTECTRNTNAPPELCRTTGGDG